MENFHFTDNSVVEAAVFKGTSSNQKLFELVLNLKELELTEGLRIHLVHVAGTRMIEQGTDSLSRGSMFEGVMKTGDMLSWVPLHLSALTVQPNLMDWLRSWFITPFTLQPLTPYDWYLKGQDIVGFELNSAMSLFLSSKQEHLSGILLQLLWMQLLNN